MGCFASKSEETLLDDGEDGPVKPTKPGSKDGKASSTSAPPGETTQLIDEITERVAGIRGKAEEYRLTLQGKVIEIEQEQAETSKDDQSNFNGVAIAAYSPESDVEGTTLLEAKQGQRVEIIVRDSGGWSYCRLEETSAMGWLPSSRVAEIARVIADHDAAGHEGLLSVVKNDYVEVVNRHYSGWALCREWKGPPLPGAAEPKEGWVTDSYLEDKRSEAMLASKWHRLVLQALDQVVASALELEGVLAQAKAQDWGTDVPMEWMGQCLEFARWLTSELQSITQAVSQHQDGPQSGSYAIIQWETKPGSDAELAVCVGARVLVLDADNQDWAWCRLETTGDEGWVPRNVLKPEGDDRPSPADGPGLKFEDLPIWVRENTPARWWSTSGSRYCEVVISKVDLAEREVTVTFKVDASCWKSVGFDHFAQSPDVWLLQPLEEKAMELRMQLPSWIEVGAGGFWWSASQQRVHRVTVEKVCTKRRAVYVTFDVDSQVRKSVPFHEMIDDPDACLLQKSEKDHVWRVKRKGKKDKRKKEKKKDAAPRIEGLPAGDDGTDLDDLIDDDDDDDDDFDDDELEALALTGTGRKARSKEALGHSFNMGASNQLDTIFNDMQQDLSNMPGDSDAAGAGGAGEEQDPWASGILRSPTAPEGRGLRTLADAASDEEARPPSIGRGNSTTFEELGGVVAAALGAEAPDAAAAAPTAGKGLRPPADPADPAADGSSGAPSAAEEEAGQESLRQRASTIALDELREELETITVTDTPTANGRPAGALMGAAAAGADGACAAGDLLGGGGASASGAELGPPRMPGRFATPSKQVPGLADIQGTATPAQPPAAGSPSIAGSPVAPTPGMPTPGGADGEGARQHASAGGSRPVSTAPSVGGSTVGELRDVNSRGNGGGGGGPRGAAKAMDEEYTTSEQGLMDQLDSFGAAPSGAPVAAQASAEGVFYNTHDKRLLEELTGDHLVTPKAGSGAAVAAAIAAAADSAPAPAPAPAPPPPLAEEEGGRAQGAFVEDLGAPTPVAEAVANAEPAPLPPSFDGDDAGAAPPRPAHASASSTWGGGAEGGAPRPPRRLAAANAWGDEPAAGGAAEASPSKPAPARRAEPPPGGEGMGKMGSMGSLLSEDADPVEKDLREAADAFGGGSSSSSLLKQAMRVALPDTWDSEGEGGRREPPDLRRLAEAWPELSDELAAAGATRQEKLRKSLDEELTREEARVDAIVQEIGHKLEQRARNAEAKLDPSGAQKYRSMQWTVMNAGESFKESCKEELDARAALRKERSRRQRENLRKALDDPAAAVVSAFLPGAESIQKLRPDVAFDEVADAVRDLFRSVEVTALRPASAQTENFLSMDRSTVIARPFEQVGEAAVRALGDSVAELLAQLRSKKEALPPKDDIIEDLQWDGLNKEQKREKTMFDGQQEFDWERAVKLGSEERARKRTSYFAEKVQRADNILRRRWRRTRDHDRSTTMQRLAAFGDAIGQAEDRIRQIYRESAERADAEVESVVEERRSTQQQAELMLSAALIVREEKETMNNAWYAAPRERQQVMHKCLKRVRRLQEDMKNEKVVPELQQKLSVLLYSLRMLEAKLMNECQATLNDIQDGPVKLSSKQKKQLEDSRRAFEEQLEADIDRIRAANSARAERAVSRIASEFRATAESKHAPSLEAARAALAASAASVARADLAAVALRSLGEAAASLYAEAARHAEVVKSPLDAPSFLPKRKRLIDALDTSLKTLQRLEKALARPTEQLAAAASSGAAAASSSAGSSGDRDWAAALAGAEKRWSEFCERHPGREPGDDGDETPRSQAEVMQEGSPPKPFVALDLGDLSQDGMSPKGSVRSLESVDSPGLKPGSRAGRRNSGGGARAKANPTGKAKAKSQAKGSSPRGERPERPTSAVPNQRPPSAGGQRGAPPSRKVGFQAVAKGSDIGAEPRSRGAKGQGAELLAQLDELSQAMDKTLGKTTGTFARPSGAGPAPARAAPPARRGSGSGNSLAGTMMNGFGGFSGGSPPARRGGAAAAW